MIGIGSVTEIGAWIGTGIVAGTEIGVRVKV